MAGHEPRGVAIVAHLLITRVVSGGSAMVVRISFVNRVANSVCLYLFPVFFRNTFSYNDDSRRTREDRTFVGEVWRITAFARAGGPRLLFANNPVREQFGVCFSSPISRTRGGDNSGQA